MSRSTSQARKRSRGITWEDIFDAILIANLPFQPHEFLDLRNETKAGLLKLYGLRSEDITIIVKRCVIFLKARHSHHQVKLNGVTSRKSL